MGRIVTYIYLLNFKNHYAMNFSGIFEKVTLILKCLSIR